MNHQKIPLIFLILFNLSPISTLAVEPDDVRQLTQTGECAESDLSEIDLIVSLPARFR